MDDETTQGDVISQQAWRLRHHEAPTGQVMLEYCILFAVIALLTIVGFTQFDEGIKTATDTFVKHAATSVFSNQ